MDEVYRATSLAEAWGERRAIRDAVALLAPAMRHLRKSDPDAALASISRVHNRLMKCLKHAEDQVEAMGFNLVDGRMTDRRKGGARRRLPPSAE